MKQGFYIGLFLAWFLLIIFLSVIPDNSIDTIEINDYELRLDYLKHLLVYLPLGYVLMRIQSIGTLLFFLIGIFVSISPEFIQYFIPYRTFNPLDVASNFLGLLSGKALYFLIRRKVKI